MANKYLQSAQSSATLVVYDAPTGGNVSTLDNGDTLNLNGYALTINTARFPAAGTLASITGLGNAGSMILNPATTGDIDVYSALAVAGAASPFILVSGSPGSLKTVTFHFSAATAGSGHFLRNDCGANGYVVLGCSITAGGTVYTYAIYQTGAGSTRVQGTVTGGRVGNARGIYAASSGDVTVDADLVGGGHADAPGAYNLGTGNIYVYGRIQNSAQCDAFRGKPVVLKPWPGRCICLGGEKYVPALDHDSKEAAA